MKLATERTAAPDGRLLVVSRDLTQVAPADHIAPNLLAALEHWDRVSPALQDVYDRLNSGDAETIESFDPNYLAAPLPRTWQWLDGSAYPTHGQLMQQAYNLSPLPTEPPLMYQGMSHQFLSPTEDTIFPDPAHGIDFEGELGAITGEVRMRASSDEALGAIRLLVQINDWSLRALGAAEMKTGFGWITAKPACSIAPVAVTPDEFGSAWSEGRLAARLRISVNGTMFGDVESQPMEFGFHDLIAHAATTRKLCAGTIVGSGTLSSPDFRKQGSCCIAERRAIETIEYGAPRTPFLSDGDHVQMTARLDGIDEMPFGGIDQRVSIAQ